MRPRQVVLAIVTLIAVARPTDAHGQERAAPAGPTHHIYITAVSKDGIPVKDLAPADIKVREDGTIKPVVAVQAATAPLTIALLVDDTGPGLRYIREGAGQFIQRLAGHSEIALVSIAKNITLVDYTTRVEQLYNGVRQLQTQNSATAVDRAYLLAPTTRSARSRSARRSVPSSPY